MVLPLMATASAMVPASSMVWTLPLTMTRLASPVAPDPLADAAGAGALEPPQAAAKTAETRTNHARAAMCGSPGGAARVSPREGAPCPIR